MKAADEKAKREVAYVKAVIDDSEMELPEAMIETQQSQIVNDFAQRLQMQGMNMDQYLQYTGNTVEQMLAQVKPQAIERIKSRLVLEAVAAAEKIEATEEDVAQELERMAGQYRMELDKLKELMADAEMKQLKSDLAVQKAADFLVENVKEGKKAAKKSKDAEGEEKPKKTVKKTAKKAEEAEGEEKPKTTRKKKTEETEA